MRFWPLEGNARLIGHPVASNRNNNDKSSQRAHVLFLAEERDLHKGTPISRGSLVDYEARKITATTMSTTVAELDGLMRCFGTCLFIRGLWSDISGELADVHIRTDANNLVLQNVDVHPISGPCCRTRPPFSQPLGPLFSHSWQKIFPQRCTVSGTIPDSLCEEPPLDKTD